MNQREYISINILWVLWWKKKKEKKKERNFQATLLKKKNPSQLINNNFIQKIVSRKKIDRENTLIDARILGKEHRVATTTLRSKDKHR